MVNAMDSPMALQKLYLPPTQSQNSNMFSLAMPNSTTAFSLVDRATKCLATWAASPDCCINQSLALWALVMVSWVVNVLEAIKNKVSSADITFRHSAICVPSTLDTKCTCIPSTQKGFRASVTMTGPRSLPPMPMLTICLMGLSEYPFHSPE